MTSEPSQQYGWSSPDRDDQADGAQRPSSAFGLFEAPDAPEEFPVFTPSSDAGSTDAEFPPDSDPLQGRPAPFSGFPPDDSYVPAPAVLPIPGVRHDPEPAPSTNWSDSYSSDSYSSTSDSYPSADSPASSASDWSSSVGSGSTPDPEPEESSGVASWAAFAAGDAPKLAPAPTPWQEAAAAAREQTPGAAQYYSPEPVADPAPPPVAPVVASARVSAAVPLPNRVDPQEVPAVTPPKTTGRVYGSSAAAPADPDPAEASSSAYGGSPAAPPGQYASSSYGNAGQPESAVVPQQAVPQHDDAAVQPGAPVRATARASVNIVPPTPGDTPPPIVRSSTVYGSPAPAAQAPPIQNPPIQGGPIQGAGAPAPLPPASPGTVPSNRQNRPHAFGDLLGPAPTGGPEQQISPPGVPMQRTPQGGPPSGSASVPVSAHQPVQAAHPEPAHQPAADRATAKPERNARLIVGVLVGSVALLAIAFGGLILVDKIFNTATFAVGDCVKQNATDAVAADCTEDGAFQVKSSVGSADECEDRTMPYVEQGRTILCLVPAKAPVAVTPTTDPSTAPS